jgi:hypothetical protein
MVMKYKLTFRHAGITPVPRSFFINSVRSFARRSTLVEAWNSGMIKTRGCESFARVAIVLCRRFGLAERPLRDRLVVGSFGPSRTEDVSEGGAR